MFTQETLNEIKSRWTELYPAAKVKGQIICPICGHGKGGDGICRNVKSSDPHALKCFGCGFSGDVISLIQQETGLEFGAAVEHAAEQLRIPINTEESTSRAESRQDPTPAPKEKSSPAKELYKTYRENLPGSPGEKYLKSRGISLATVKSKAAVGYIPEYKTFNTDQNGKNHPATWQGLFFFTGPESYSVRNIDEAPMDPEKKNRYRKSGPAGLFRRSALYTGSRPIFVVEGEIDALSILELNEEAVAIGSISNLDLFLKQIDEKRPTRPLIIALDNDPAGQTAGSKLFEELEKRNVPATLDGALYGAAKDANEALMKNRQVFELALKEAVNSTSPISRFLSKIQTEAFKPFETGLKFFDDLLSGGPIRQTLLFLLAAPGTGKTTLCQQIAESIAKNGHRVIYINLEMSEEQMLAKGISGYLFRHNHKKYTSLDILQGYKWTPEQQEEICLAGEKYSLSILKNLWYEGSNLSNYLEDLNDYLQEIGSESERTNAESPVIFLDYLHLLTSKDKIDTQEIIKRTTKILKRYAMRYNTIAVAIAATNRASNKSGKQTMDSARDSSDIEYSGDVILSLNYADIDSGKVSPSNPDKVAALYREPWRRMVLRVNKSRFSVPGRTRNLYFRAAYNSFFDATDKDLPEDPDRVAYEDGDKSIEKWRPIVSTTK